MTDPDFQIYCAFKDLVLGTSNLEWYCITSPERAAAVKMLREQARAHGTEWRLRGLKRTYRKETFMLDMIAVLTNEEVRRIPLHF